MVALAPECRGKGLAKYLTNEAFRKLDPLNLDWIYMTTWDDKISAIKNYIRAGFLPVLTDDAMIDRWKTIMKICGYSSLQTVNPQGMIDQTIYT